MASLSVSEIDSIIKELKEKIADKRFVERYGSSISMAMGYDYELRLKKEYERLMNEFKIIDKDSNDIIDVNELTEFLSVLKRERQLEVEIDEVYIEDIFRLIDLNSDEKITT